MSKHQQLSRRYARLGSMLTAICAILFVAASLQAAVAHESSAPDQLRPCAILEIRAATDESFSADQRDRAVPIQGVRERPGRAPSCLPSEP
jgi:hypothetical protein